MKKIFAICLAVSTISGSCFANDAKPNEFWWPNIVNLKPLRYGLSENNPYGAKFNYAKEFSKLNIEDVKKDINKVLTTSQDWWPADYGNYGPFFIRMAWHSAGTYRSVDGRGGAGGGQQRFEPLNSWPDNANLDKARRLLWSVKQKYGKSLSWADLMILAGNVSLESMGFKTIGFACGRQDDWEPEIVNWGPENAFMQAKRTDSSGKLQGASGATTMGLIYVNPEGPGGSGDVMGAAKEIRETFGRMAMNDEETVALIAGGHSFGKNHGAHKPSDCVGQEPAAAGIEDQGLGWKNKCGTGNGKDNVTSGLEGSWTATPTQWSINYLTGLLENNWIKTKSPAGAIQYVPSNTKILAPSAHDASQKVQPVMLVTDIALKTDPEYLKICQRFLKNPQEFEAAFARAWFKLTHRDMGPSARYLGKDVPKESFIWQDPLSKSNYKAITQGDVENLKIMITKSTIDNAFLVKAAWAGASTYRKTDMRGGINGSRLRFEPQMSWKVNNPQELSKTIAALEDVRIKFNKTLKSGKQVSFADVVVLAGGVAIEKAAKDAGIIVKVPFTIGRVDATIEQTDVKSFALLEPKYDGFRNYHEKNSDTSPIDGLIEKAYMLNLTIPEMTVLIGGLRVINANFDGSLDGVLTKTPGKLNNDFFINLLDNSTKWVKLSENGLYKGVDIATNEQKWTATPVDLVFGSSSELRAVAEVYASQDGKQKFVDDFVKAWVKVMNNDRF
jgi:catalase-peroxidase